MVATRRGRKPHDPSDNDAKDAASASYLDTVPSIDPQIVSEEDRKPSAANLDRTTGASDLAVLQQAVDRALQGEAQDPNLARYGQTRYPQFQPNPSSAAVDDQQRAAAAAAAFVQLADDSKVAAVAFHNVSSSTPSQPNMMSFMSAERIANMPPVNMSGKRRVRLGWTKDETSYLMDGCKRHGVGNWKKILTDPRYEFNCRTAVDLKDRFRTSFPEEYSRLYPNAKTHKVKRRTVGSDGLVPEPDFGDVSGSSGLVKINRKERRAFTSEEDARLLEGFLKHGPAWSKIQRDSSLQFFERRSTDLRDRFRNAFPERYTQAGYKGRAGSRKSDTQVSPSNSSASNSAILQDDAADQQLGARYIGQQPIMMQQAGGGQGQNGAQLPMQQFQFQNPIYYQQSGMPLYRTGDNR
jgi:hypothetical protein